jgi:MoxR-like ATPase
MEFFRKHFDPVAAGGVRIDDTGDVKFPFEGEPDEIYVYQPRAILALNVALSTRRPLLISGEPGCGKSTLARNAALVLRSCFYKHMVTSRTQASDLLWTFDTLQRLNDAQAKKLRREDQFYVEPGTLWWAFSPETARQRGNAGDIDEADFAADPGILGDVQYAVVLMDEIDKADPDVPNDLLEPLDLKQFTVRETKDVICARRDVLFILTTNGEREMPPAFLRRCVRLSLDIPEERMEDWLIGIAESKLGPSEDQLNRAVAGEVVRLRQAAQRAGVRKPSTGEYLDTLRVCRDLDVGPESEVWNEVIRSVLWKDERAPRDTRVTADDFVV